MGSTLVHLWGTLIVLLAIGSSTAAPSHPWVGRNTRHLTHCRNNMRMKYLLTHMFSNHHISASLILHRSSALCVPFRRFSAMTLCNLSTHEDCKTTLIFLHGLPPLIEMLDGPSDLVKRYAAMTLCNLSTLAANQVRLSCLLCTQMVPRRNCAAPQRASP